MLNWISRFLRRIFADTRPPYVPGIDPFPKLDMERLRARLEPQERGTRAGQSNLPASNTQSPDANELEIESFFVGELTTSARICDDQLKAYAQSIQALGPANPISAVARIKGTAVGDLSTLQRSGSNQLHTTVQRAEHLSRDLLAFRERNGLTRAAVYPESKVYHWGVLAILLVVETLMNGYMFAQGSSFGLLGGALEAVFFSIGNLALGAALGGGLILPLLCYRSAFKRYMLGVPLTVIFVVGAVLYNLGVAHYRQALTTPPHTNAATRALESLRLAPLVLNDLLGWLLFVIGFAFCLVAAFDWLRMDDPYPGFGKLDRLSVQAKQDYADAVDDVYGAARRDREHAFAALSRLSSGLAIDKQQRQVLHERGQHLVTQLANHQDYLQTCFRTLVSEFRSANGAARSTQPPTFFATLPTLRTTALPALAMLPADTDFEQELRIAQAEIDAAYQQAIMAFDTVSTLTETKNGFSPRA